MKIQWILVSLLSTSILMASGSLKPHSNVRNTINSAKKNKDAKIQFLGKGARLRNVISLSKLLKNPDQYVGKRVTVEGKITDVCPMAGCWMILEDAHGNEIRIKVRDGVIVFPMDAIGSYGRAQGKFRSFELSKERAVKYLAHLAEEKGEEFDPASVKGPMTLYQVSADGAIIKKD